MIMMLIHPIETHTKITYMLQHYYWVETHSISCSAKLTLRVITQQVISEPLFEYLNSKTTLLTIKECMFFYFFCLVL